MSRVHAPGSPAAFWARGTRRGSGVVALTGNPNPADVMRISVDDWLFREAPAGMLVLDAFLNNGQHAVIEVNPMRNTEMVNGEVPEVIVFCEFPGEKVTEEGSPARWVSRPPSRECPWSNVSLPQALTEQIRDRCGMARATPAV